MNFTKKRKIALSVVLSLIFLYLLFGFLILPRIVKSKFVKEFSDITGSEVTLGRLSTNPIFLTASINDFKIKKNGDEVMAFDNLYINFSLKSIVSRSLNFSELIVDKPFVKLVISEQGRLNILDLIPEKKDEVKNDKSGEDEGIFPILIDKIAFKNGKVVFEDLTTQTPFKNEIRSLSFNLSNLSTLPGEKGLYKLNATLNEDALIDWEGSLKLNPVSSEGTLRFKRNEARNLWRYIQDMVNFKVVSGGINFEAEYNIELSGNEKTVNLKNGTVSLNNFKMVSNAGSYEVISIPLLNLDGVDFELVPKRLDISKITAADGEINGLIDENGELNFTRLLKTEDEPSNNQEKKSVPVSKSNPLDLNINEIDINGYKITFRDESLKEKAEFTFDSTDLNIKNFSLAKSEMPVSFSTVFNDTGKVNIEGQFVAPDFASSTSITLQEIPLKPFEPYTGEFAGISVEEGTLSAEAEFVNQKQDGQMNLNLKGDMNIKGFRAIETSGDKLVNFDYLQVAGLSFALPSRILDIEKVAVNKLDSNIAIGPDGAVNIKNLVKANESQEYEKEENVRLEENKKDNGFKTSISEIDINEGILEFADYSVDPNFKTTIEDLNVRLKGLSTKESKTASIELSGNIDKYAPLKIKGEIKPLGNKNETDIDLDLEGLELTNLNPYSAKYVGYKMDRGKLSLNLEYILNEKLLEGKNKVVFDQIELGNKVDSPNAKDIPLELALSLLKDSSGAVELDFPVSGDPTDPSFSISGIVFKTFFNLILKSVTSPFSILSSIVGIFGSGEDLSQVTFQPGSFNLSEKEIKDLDNLSKALSKRPNLKLEIRGTAYDKVDRLALAEKQIIMDVRDDGKNPADPLSEDEIEDILEIYENDFAIDPLDNVPKKDENGKKFSKIKRLQSAYDNVIGKLKDFETVKDQSMIELARNRADAIRSYISSEGGIKQERIFTLEPLVKSGTTPESVKVELSVGKL